MIRSWASASAFIAFPWQEMRPLCKAPGTPSDVYSWPILRASRGHLFPEASRVLQHLLAHLSENWVGIMKSPKVVSNESQTEGPGAGRPAGSARLIFEGEGDKFHSSKSEHRGWTEPELTGTRSCLNSHRWNFKYMKLYSTCAKEPALAADFGWSREGNGNEWADVSANWMSVYSVPGKHGSLAGTNGNSFVWRQMPWVLGVRLMDLWTWFLSVHPNSRERLLPPPSQPSLSSQGPLSIWGKWKKRFYMCVKSHVDWEKTQNPNI